MPIRFDMMWSSLVLTFTGPKKKKKKKKKKEKE